MKFKFNPSPLKPMPSVSVDAPAEVSSTPHPTAVAGFYPKCCDCLRNAELLAKGTSLCRPCYEERLRMGKI